MSLARSSLGLTALCRGVRHGKVSLHALVIGIDKYFNHRELSGAVADANAVDTYLRCYLNVPESQICNLRDEQATRVAIIEAFKALGENPDINHDDPIFIYYAGHGGEQEAPSGWETGGEKIQVIIPRDTGLTISTRQPIPPIPDLTIAALLDNLADKKGNNIVRPKIDTLVWGRTDPLLYFRLLCLTAAMRHRAHGTTRMCPGVLHGFQMSSTLFR